ncbi:MAG: hypothetical protein IPP32_12865 [Bacteroidetes bacterium]|nr:hypothetical protein [Bacteroidota bacterium]
MQLKIHYTDYQLIKKGTLADSLHFFLSAETCVIEAYGTATDSRHNVYYVGCISGGSVAFSGTTVTTGNQKNGFIAKSDSLGSLVWVRTIYGHYFDNTIYGISIDKDDRIYVVGTFNATINFGNGITLTNSANTEIFVARYNVSGNTV